MNKSTNKTPLTRKQIRNLILDVLERGGAVSRVIVSSSEWRQLLEDFLENEIISPNLVLIFNIPVQPKELPEGDRVRTEP